jgi:hypothetical protein
MNDPLQRASVTLLIHGDDLLPQELSVILGVQPEIGVQKGETFMSRGRPGSAVTASTGKWIVGTGYRDPPNIDEQITMLLRSLPESADIWTELTTRFDCCVTVGAWFTKDSWTGGLVLQPKTLGMLAERRLAIDFDMYAPGASE